MAYLKWKSNFSFKKLADKLDSAVEKFGASNIKDFTRAAKDAVRKGKFEPLSKSTLRSRRQGRGWAGKKVGKTNSKRPLIHTGRLLNSIQEKDGEFTMVEYGFRHNAGFTTSGGKRVPARPFLPFSTEQDKFSKANMKSLYTILNKVMKTRKI